MVLENVYLRKAITKAGYVVIVKTCFRNNRKSKLEYVSPNADILGMNVELLNKELKLTEDYIHPEDREKVISTMKSAIDSRLQDYQHRYRIIGDDGNIYHVSNEIVFGDSDDESFRVEFYLRNITEKSKDVKEMPIRKQSEEMPIPNRAEVKKEAEKDKLPEVMRIFSKITGLYSALVGSDGKVVFQPTGPATNMGDFYDLFEKPAYKKYYQHIWQTVSDNDEPVIFPREEGGIGKISAAPIKLNGEIRGIWLLGSYTEREGKKLKSVYEDQWILAQVMSAYLYKSMIAEAEGAKSRGAGLKLREELERQGIINDALSKINSKLIDTVDQVVEETLRDVGLHLNVDKIVLYTDGKHQGDAFALRSFWDVSGNPPGEEFLETLPRRRRDVEKEIMESDGEYAIDRSNLTEESKLKLMRYNCKAVIAYPIYMNDRMYGLLFFGESRAERIWTKEELRFAKSIALLVQNMIENADGDDNIRNVNKHLIETYNNFKVGLFVRHAYTGEVLFSNTAMNEMLGRDFTGGDSREILTDLHDRFDNIANMGKESVAQNRVANWRSYIQRLDEIMDITAITMEWLNGEPASFVILRKATNN